MQEQARVTLVVMGTVNEILFAKWAYSITTISSKMPSGQSRAVTWVTKSVKINTDKTQNGKCH